MLTLKSLKRFLPTRAQLMGGALILSAGTLAYAVPNVFTSGTPISASQMNANFANVESQVANPNVTGNITLVPSTATAGNILKGTVPFLHNFGDRNIFLGENAGNFTMTGSSNTATGVSALPANTTGNSNTAIGNFALFFNTTGNNNTASGMQALLNNTTGSGNTASGTGALALNTTGSDNTASGMDALASNTTGSDNTASGSRALFRNEIGTNNTASGGQALLSNTTGNSNTASGWGTLRNNTTGGANTAVGMNALANNTTGSSNIAIGNQAGGNLTGSNNIAIGNIGVAGDTGTIRIGDSNQTRTFIAGIRGVTTATAAIPVVVGTDGQLGTTSSSRRVKDDIADMGTASDVLMKLRPVIFHYKSDRNSKARTLQYGLIAEEVNEIAPNLVARNAQGEIETVYYQHLAPMLLNEVQKQQRVIQAQTARVAELEKQAQEIVALKRELARLTVALSREPGQDNIVRASR